jgi:hypothetical protein
MLPLNKAEKPLSKKRRVPPAHGGHRQEVSGRRQQPSRPRRRAREKHREEWIFFYCFQQGIISLFVMVHMVWVLFIPESGTFENPVEEPLTVVQELSVEMHLLAWIWMVVVAAPPLEQGAASRLSSNTLLGWGLAYLFAPFALCIVLLVAKCLAGSMLVI